MPHNLRNLRKSIIQTVLVPKSKFTSKEASEWIRKHKYIHKKIDSTGHYYRFRQTKPNGKRSDFYTVPLNNGVKLVYQA